MITIHHLVASQSERIIWLMEELGLPYALKIYHRDPATFMAPAALREIHPIGQAPVIQDGDVRLAESLAITHYILESYGGGRLCIRPGAPGYADYLYWLVYSIGGLMPQAIQIMISARMGGNQDDPRAAMIQERRSRHFRMIDARLSANEWLAGDTFTAADIMCQFPFGTMSQFAPLDISNYLGIRRWLDRINDRPAFQRAMKVDTDALAARRSHDVE